ncbi:Hypothetical predicted protein [Octopus vulgaris]|uniref:Uncharacterized protein n=1 Tax=Octopus vulgaris TaxID=6645 RepID=A0AA36AR59_OCTVU|nr:Hypothetical predicted protein [Octopus vulgaris]
MLHEYSAALSEKKTDQGIIVKENIKIYLYTLEIDKIRNENVGHILGNDQGVVGNLPFMDELVPHGKMRSELDKFLCDVRVFGNDIRMEFVFHFGCQYVVTVEDFRGKPFRELRVNVTIHPPNEKSYIDSTNWSNFDIRFGIAQSLIKVYEVKRIKNEERPSQERHTTNSYSIWRTRNQDSRPYLDENKLANVRRDIFRNNRLTDSEISAIKHATENDINIRHKGNEESDEQYSPPRGLIERLPSDQSTQRPEDTINSIVPVKDSQENEKTTVTEDLAFAEEHRESMAEMRQKILNTLEVVNINPD